MKRSDFYYELPKELIAQTPSEKRDESRLLILDKKNKTILHKQFKNMIDFLNKGDCLVLNDTRVIPARLYGVKEVTGAKIEFVLLKRVIGNKWEVMLKPGKRAKPCSLFIFGNGILKAKVLEIVDGGNRIVEFLYNGIFEEILDKIGLMPLPPYITEDLHDKERYQTVYSDILGSAAAPTAGLHFTNKLLEMIKSKGINIAKVTLHIGLGTFRPVKVDNIVDHKMHSEFYSISDAAMNIINSTKNNGGRIIAVGTTSCRVLESNVDSNNKIKSGSSFTEIFIYPGYKFKIVDAMITNFHLPESTLLMLISAFSDREFVLSAYKEAISEKYRFFSFGDAMFIF